MDFKNQHDQDQFLSGTPSQALNKHSKGIEWNHQDSKYTVLHQDSIDKTQADGFDEDHKSKST
jgi:hypothetical protein